MTTQSTHLIDIRVHSDPGDCELLEHVLGRVLCCVSVVFRQHSRDTYWRAVLLR